jgi:hypothetical protein
VPRPSLLVSALAIAALLAAAPVAAAPGRASEPDGADIEFRVGATSGLHAEVQAEYDGDVTLEISRKGRLVQYEVEGESTEAGLKARFGKLGEIDVVFTATETKEAELPAGCDKEPYRRSKGVFHGTIQFAGERGYVQIDARRAKGMMDVPGAQKWECRRSALGSTKPNPEEAPAALSVLGRSCGCRFAAVGIHHPNGRGLSVFYGIRTEAREGMGIVRVTYAGAGGPAFEFDLASGIAKVDPPSPFSGHGSFRRRAGKDLWRGTISVPVLGADPVEIRSRGARARLGEYTTE